VHVLRKGILVFDDDKFVPAGTGTPMDAAQAIPLHVFTNTMQIDAFSAADTSILLLLPTGTKLAIGSTGCESGCRVNNDFVRAI
jgi:hypothetical protein